MIFRHSYVIFITWRPGVELASRPVSWAGILLGCLTPHPAAPGRPGSRLHPPKVRRLVLPYTSHCCAFLRLSKSHSSGPPLLSQ